MSLFLLWAQVQMFILGQQLIKFDHAISQNPHLQTAYHVLSEKQRFFQLEFGVTPKPMKRNNQEIMAIWLLSFTQDFPTDSHYLTHP